MHKETSMHSLAMLIALSALPLPPHDPVTADPGATCTHLRELTQLFSDAGQRGDPSVAQRVLDERVIFFNEGGDSASKADMTAKGTPQPGVTTKMTVTDWRCELHGNVAVASFIDDQQQNFHGQAFHARYRSVETWHRAAHDWKMIGSETIALQDDPTSVKLTPAELDEYLGNYIAAPGVNVSFSRQGEELFAALNGGKPTLQRPELKDALFSVGNPRSRKIFRRDEHAKVVAFVLRREGHDILFTRVR